MEKEIKLTSETALRVCVPLGIILRDKSVPKEDRDCVFGMIEGIKQFMNKEDFDNYCKSMKFIEEQQANIDKLAGQIQQDFNSKNQKK